MKKIFLSAMLTFLAAPLLAGDMTQVAAAITTTPSPEAQANSWEHQGKDISATANAPKISFDIKSEFQEDAGGQVYVDEIGLKAQQALFKSFTADCNVRIIKPASNQGSPVTLDLTTANFTYTNTFFAITAGREEMSKTISTMNYFGPYVTAGQRFLDLVGAVIPFSGDGISGIPEIGRYNIEAAFYYIPAILSQQYAVYNGYQEYYIGQLKAGAAIYDTPVQILANLGKGTTEYFMYSVLSGNPSLDVSGSADLFGHSKVDISWGILNMDQTDRTSVMAAGIELHDFKQWLVILDSLIFEMQFPLADSNSQMETTGRIPWFITLQNHIDDFRYGVAASTGNNDYTLKNAVPGAGYGSGNIYCPENIEFNGARSEGTPSWYIFAGYGF